MPINVKHTHTTARTGCTLSSGGHYERCECGAVRKIESNGQPSVAGDDDREGWHTCKLCTPEFFLTEPPATDWKKLRGKP
jgi:hypothetical protein